MNYQEYLRSEHWQETRRRFKASALGKRGCYVCGTRERLDVHHKSYKRIGNERLSDLVHLCRECHHMTHHILTHQNGTRYYLWKAARRLQLIYRHSIHKEQPYHKDETVRLWLRSQRGR